MTERQLERAFRDLDPPSLDKAAETRRFESKGQERRHREYRWRQLKKLRENHKNRKG